MILVSRQDVRNLYDRFLAYEQGMCERGSGLTADQLNGAAAFVLWLEKQVERPKPVEVVQS